MNWRNTENRKVKGKKREAQKTSSQRVKIEHGSMKGKMEKIEKMGQGL